MWLILADDALLTFALFAALPATFPDCPDRRDGGDCSATEDHAGAEVVARIEAGAGYGSRRGAGKLPLTCPQSFTWRSGPRWL